MLWTHQILFSFILVFLSFRWTAFSYLQVVLLFLLLIICVIHTHKQIMQLFIILMSLYYVFMMTVFTVIDGRVQSNWLSILLIVRLCVQWFPRLINTGEYFLWSTQENVFSFSLWCFHSKSDGNKELC